MSGKEFLSVDPAEIKFPFEPRKQLSCTLQLLNKTDNHVAFKVKTTNPKKYSVKPNNGIVLPHSICNITVTMQAQKEAPPDMQCKDRFLIQSVITQPGATAKDVNPEMFNKDGGNHVEECKLRVVYFSPPRPPSPVPEEPEERLSPRASVSGNANSNDHFADSRGYVESQDNSTMARDTILKLMSDRDSIIQINDKLRRELNLLRNGRGESGGGVPVMYVLIISLICILLGMFIF